MVGAYGAPGHWDNAGAAYVFASADDGGVWFLQAKLIAHDGMGGDHFGWSVASTDLFVVVGADKEEGKGQILSGVVQEQRGPSQGGQRGDGDNCGPNSPSDCQHFNGGYTKRGASTGAAYAYTVFDSVWQQEFKLLPADTAAGDSFGSAVAIDGNKIYVGAEMAGGNDVGAAYVYVPRVIEVVQQPEPEPEPQPEPMPQPEDKSSFEAIYAKLTINEIVMVSLLFFITILFVYLYCRKKSESEIRSSDSMLLPQDSERSESAKLVSRNANIKF